MDDASQLRQAAALAVRIACWLRDEEAAGSNPATPTRSETLADAVCYTLRHTSTSRGSLGSNA